MRGSCRALVLIACLVIASAASGAERLTGVAVVIDGGTLDVADERVRLIGIDAPEGSKTCTLDGAPWRCGDEAEAALRDLADGPGVSCDVLGRDCWQRALVVCRVDGVDLGREIVRQGWALAWYPDRGAVSGPDYGLEQAEARRPGEGCGGDRSRRRRIGAAGDDPSPVRVAKRCA